MLLTENPYTPDAWSDTMNSLQAQSTEELHLLRSELDVMLQELREIADRLIGRKIQESIAA